MEKNRIILMLLLIIVLFIIQLLSSWAREKALRDKVMKYETEIWRLRIATKYSFSSNNHSTSSKTIPKDTLKYMKLALKVTHPDNGGKTEDFIKCNEIYKKLLTEYKEG